MDNNYQYKYGFVDGSSKYAIELADPRAFQFNEYAIVIKEEKEEEMSEVWKKDAFFGKRK